MPDRNSADYWSRVYARTHRMACRRIEELACSQVREIAARLVVERLACGRDLSVLHRKIKVIESKACEMRQMLKDKQRRLELARSQAHTRQDELSKSHERVFRQLSREIRLLGREKMAIVENVYALEKERMSTWQALHAAEARPKIIGAKGGLAAAAVTNEVKDYARKLARELEPACGWLSAPQARERIMTDVRAFARQRGRSYSERKVEEWLRAVGIKRG